MRQRPIAADREPAQLDREDVKEQQRHHELRRRDGGEAGDHQPGIQRLAAVQRRDHAKRQPDQQFGQDRAQHQLQRRRQAGGDQGRDLAALQIAAAHIAMQKPPEVMAVLHPDRLVEAQLAADILDHLGRGRAAGDLAHRVGGQDVKQQEGDDADAQKDQRRLDQPPDQVSRHQRCPLCVGSRTSRSASPTRLKARARSRIAAPGMKTSQGADWK